MKVYSDILTADHLAAACRAQEGVGLVSAEQIERARVRRRGWKVQLYGTSPHPRNTGRYGGQHDGWPPATWDEHGRWMAELFRRDPNARIAEYDGAEEFERSTEGAYS